MKPEEVKGAARAFREVFAHNMLFLETEDIIILGSDQPITIDVDRWRSLLEDERISGDLEEVGLSTVPQLLATYMMSTEGVDRYVGDVPPVTDDLPTLEFFGSWAAAVKQRGKNVIDLLEHRAAVDELLARLSGTLTEEESAELERLYPLEELYLRAYVKYLAGDLPAARQGFAEVLEEAPEDRRAQIRLDLIDQALAAAQRSRAPAPTGGR
jgi:hypothetical protein